MNLSNNNINNIINNATSLTLENKIFEIFDQKIRKSIDFSNITYIFDDKTFLDKYNIDLSKKTYETTFDKDFDLFINKLWLFGIDKYFLCNHINERKFFSVYTIACIEALKSFLPEDDNKENNKWSNVFFRAIHIYIERLDSRYWIASTKSVLDIYLKEVENISNDIPLDEYIEYKEENKDKLIKQNLKAVIGAAKKYQGLGLDLEDLISAGNLGLCVAWNRFDPKRTQVKEQLLKLLEFKSKTENKDIFTKQECVDMFSEIFSYGKRIDYLSEKLPETITYQALINFINKYVQSAKFSSVANSWIRAYILSELDTNSRIVKKPKSEIYKDKEETGSFVKEVTYDIMQPITNSDKQTSHGTTLGDLLDIEIPIPNVEHIEEQLLFKRALSKMMSGLKARDKRVVFKKFGIGVPRELTPKEIADSENISVARVSQILQSSFEHIQKNIGTQDYNIEELFYMAKTID